MPHGILFCILASRICFIQPPPAHTRRVWYTNCTMPVTLIHKTRTAPELPYSTMKDAILGKKYNLTLVFIGEKRAQALNKAHRHATYIPNVLSFPLDDTTGEIYIAPSVAKRECKKFNLTPFGYIGFLFIHGLLHLKGLDHGDTMDAVEKRYMKRFGLQ